VFHLDVSFFDFGFLLNVLIFFNSLSFPISFYSCFILTSLLVHLTLFPRLLLSFVAPTHQPTAYQPTTQSTSVPTHSSVLPTLVPTFAPVSPQQSGYVLISGSSPVSGISNTYTPSGQRTLSPSTLETFCDTLLTVGGAQSCSITLFFPLERRRLLEAIALEKVQLASASSTWQIDFQLKYFLVNYPTLNATTVAKQSQQTIIQAFQTGTFQTALRQVAFANNASQLLNATATTVTVAATIVEPETAPSSHSVSLTAGQVAGIVIGSIIGAILIFVLIFFLVREKRSDSRISQASRYASNNALDRNLGDLVVVDEQHSPTRLGAPRNDTSGYIDDTVTIHVDHDIERQVVGGGGLGEQSTDLTDGYLQIRL
jgi:hypothetical protein